MQGKKLAVSGFKHFSFMQAFFAPSLIVSSAFCVPYVIASKFVFACLNVSMRMWFH